MHTRIQLGALSSQLSPQLSLKLSLSSQLSLKLSLSS
jgi:hypothetical protein